MPNRNCSPDQPFSISIHLNKIHHKNTAGTYRKTFIISLKIAKVVENRKLRICSAVTRIQNKVKGAEDIWFCIIYSRVQTKS